MKDTIYRICKKTHAALSGIGMELRGVFSRIKGDAVARFNRSRIENYYYGRGEAGKNHGARWVDRLSSGVMVFVLSGMAGFMCSGKAHALLLTGSACLSIYCASERALTRNRIAQGKEELLKRETIKRFCGIVKDKTEKEFFMLVRDLFEKSGEFSKIKFIYGHMGQLLLMEGNFYGDRAGIFCKKLGQGERVEAENLREFVERCAGMGLKAGVYVTNTSFGHAAKEYAAGLSGFKLYTADIDALYRGFLKRGLLISREGVERQLERDILEKNIRLRHGIKEILEYKRVRTYASLGLLIAVYSFFVAYRTYYILISAVMLCLSGIAAVRWRLGRCRDAILEGIELDRAIENMGGGAS